MLLISRCPPFPLHQGDRLIPFHLARQLRARHHHIDLIAYYNQHSDLENIPRYEQYFRDILLIHDPQRSWLDYYQRWRDPVRMFPTDARGSWSAEMWEAISDRLGTNRYDIVELFGGVQVYEFRHLVKSLPNVIVPYESYSLFLARNLANETGWTRRLLLRAQLRAARRYERRMFEGFDRVVVLSVGDAQALHALAPDLPLHVIPNGVDTDYFIPTGHEAESPTLLFTGNFAYPPNLDAALYLVRDILPRVRRQVPAARLLLAGSSPPSTLRKLASKDVEVTGHVPDLSPYMERALIFVSPLRFGAGIKNKVLEAMAMQKPIVATPLSCEGISLHDGVNALFGRTTTELVSAVVRLIKDDALRQRMRLANRQLIEAHYTWRRVADQYEDLYKQVIQERSPQVRSM